MLPLRGRISLASLIGLYVFMTLGALAQVSSNEGRSESNQGPELRQRFYEKLASETRQLNQQLNAAKAELEARHEEERKNLRHNQGVEKALLVRSNTIERAKLKAKHETEEATREPSQSAYAVLARKQLAESNALRDRLEALERMMSDRHNSENGALRAKFKIEDSNLRKEQTIRRAELEARQEIQKQNFYADRNTELPRLSDAPLLPPWIKMMTTTPEVTNADQDALSNSVLAKVAGKCGSTLMQRALVPEYVCFGLDGDTVPWAQCAIGRLAGYKPVYFGAACNQHDRCYGQSGSQKSKCDIGFHTLLKATCDETLDGKFREHSRQSCYELSSYYYQAVKAKGCDPFKSAQKAIGAAVTFCE